MSFHGNNPIHFITFNQALPQNRTLGQNITFCFYIYKQYIVAFINFQNPYATFIHNKETPINWNRVVWFSKCNLNLYNYELQYFIFQWMSSFIHVFHVWIICSHIFTCQWSINATNIFNKNNLSFVSMVHSAHCKMLNFQTLNMLDL